MLKRTLLALAIAAAATVPAFAHLDPVEHGSFAAGFSIRSLVSIISSPW